MQESGLASGPVHQVPEGIGASGGDHVGKIPCHDATGPCVLAGGVFEAWAVAGQPVLKEALNFGTSL